MGNENGNHKTDLMILTRVDTANLWVTPIKLFMTYVVEPQTLWGFLLSKTKKRQSLATTETSVQDWLIDVISHLQHDRNAEVRVKPEWLISSAWFASSFHLGLCARQQESRRPGPQTKILDVQNTSTLQRAGLLHVAPRASRGKNTLSGSCLPIAQSNSKTCNEADFLPDKMFGE